MAGKGNVRETIVKEWAEKRDFEVLGTGWPDFLLFNNTTKDYLFLEVKAPSDSVSKEQERMHSILRQLGLNVRTVKVPFDKYHARLALNEVIEYIKPFDKDAPKVVMLDKEMVNAGRSRRNGWSRAQLRLLGVNYPLKKGWRRGLTGKIIPTENYERFLALKNRHLKTE